jgi:hypothetical protein
VVFLDVEKPDKLQRQKANPFAIPPVLVGAGLNGSIAQVPVENKPALTKTL